MGRKARLLRVACDAVRARAGGPAAIAARRDRRLGEMLWHARQVPFYQRHWSGIRSGARLADLPPVSKEDWVEGFEVSVSDRSITRAAVWEYMQDRSRVGRPWLDRYSVCRSSGVAGKKSLFVNDQDAMDVYWALWLTRGWMPWLGARGGARLGQRGGRVAALIATNGHYASAAMVRRPSPLGAVANVRSTTLSILKPMSRIDRALEYWQPAALVGYPTALDRLAVEQRDGRLALDIVVAVSVSEWVEPAARVRIEAAFGCPLRDSYAASEFLALGFECPERWLHVNSDWVVLELVDAELRPVPPGETSHTALVTNLANRTQPVVRHDLGDRVMARPDPCPCGSPLPAVRVEGRQNDTLIFRDDGREVGLMPMALITLLGAIPGLEPGSQLIQTAEDALSLRVRFSEGADPDATWEEVERRIGSHLRSHGLPHVRVERSPDPPGRDPRTGKLRRTWSEVPVSVR
ncbi:MAG TPA: phenylacetate--CoA ligase family protein [Gemmatimonadota bacterium]|nr:phenylacetate--CoA ligase family protein [Gemmatimonadota bacterium]